MTVACHRPPALATAVLTTGVVVVGAQAFVLAPLLPDVAAGLAATTAEAGRALSTYGAGIVASALLLGRRLDAVPRRLVLVAGMGALAMAAAGSAAAPNWSLLALAQLVGGLGVGVVLPATYALAAELAPPGAGARATGWRAAFGALAAFCAGQVALYALLPATPTPGAGRRAFSTALRAPGVAALLTAVLAYMAAFYGVYAFVGFEVRALHGGGATTAGLVALSYGVGFGLAAAADRLLDRWDTARLVAPALALLAAVYLALPATVGVFAVFLAVAAVWGLVNHVGLTLLVSRLAEVAPGLRGAVLALNTAATYGGAAVAGALAGPLYEVAGFGWLAGCAAVLLTLAVPVTASRTGRPDGSGKPHS
jgi:predicted MFS family arabinose efflux permease